MYFHVREPGALGIASKVVVAADYDAFRAKHPELEVLAVFLSLDASRALANSDWMWAHMPGKGK